MGTDFTSFKISGQTASGNVFRKRTGQTNHSFRPSFEFQKQQANRPSDICFECGQQGHWMNTSLYNVGKEATQKATNTEVRYDKNIHFISGDFVDTDGRNVEFEEGRNKQSVKGRLKYSIEFWKNTL